MSTRKLNIPALGFEVVVVGASAKTNKVIADMLEKKIATEDEPQVRRFLLEVDVRIVKRVIVEASSRDEAVDIASTISVESLALGEADNAVVLGDEPAGNGSGSVDVLAEDGDARWDYYFGEKK
jgi:hypothetical protein